MNTSSPSQFGAELRATIENAGWKIRPFARKAGLAVPHLYRIFKGEVSPTIGTLAKIAEALNKKIEFRFSQKPVCDNETCRLWTNWCGDLALAA